MSDLYDTIEASRLAEEDRKRKKYPPAGEDVDTSNLDSMIDTAYNKAPDERKPLSQSDLPYVDPSMDHGGDTVSDTTNPGDDYTHKSSGFVGPPSPNRISDRIAASFSAGLGGGKSSSMAYDTASKALQDAYSSIRDADPKEREKLRNLERDAHALYVSDANRNSWMALADRIGAALTKIGGGVLGNKLGVDMTRADTGSGYDWVAANKEARQRYLDTVDQLEREGKDLTEKEKLALQKQLFSIEGLKVKQGEEKYKYGQDYQAAREDARSKAAMDRAEIAQKNAEDRMDARSKDAEKSRTAREVLAMKKASFQDLAAEEKQAQDQLNAANTVLTQVKQLGKLDSNKAINEINKKMGPIAGKSGLDLEQVTKLQEDTRGGMFGADKDKERDAAFSNLLGPIKQKLENIRARKDALLKGNPTQLSEETPAPETTQPASDIVVVVNPQGVKGTIPRSQLNAALAQGYREVK